MAIIEANVGVPFDFCRNCEELEIVEARLYSDGKVVHTTRTCRNESICEAAVKLSRKYQNDGWIPVGRVMPDTNKPVLISGIHRTSGQRGVYIARYSGMVWQYDGFTFPDIKIEAWKPLPEPFEGGEDE